MFVVFCVVFWELWLVVCCCCCVFECGFVGFEGLFGGFYDSGLKGLGWVRLLDLREGCNGGIVDGFVW